MRIDSPLLLLINIVIVVVVVWVKTIRSRSSAVAILNKINTIQIGSKSRSAQSQTHTTQRDVESCCDNNHKSITLISFCHGIHHPKFCVFLLKDKNFITSTWVKFAVVAIARVNRHLFHLFWLSFVVVVVVERRDKRQIFVHFFEPFSKTRIIATLIQIQMGGKAWFFPELRTKSTLKVIWNEDEMVNSLICLTSLRYWFSLTLISISLCASSHTRRRRHRELLSFTFLFDEIAIFLPLSLSLSPIHSLRLVGVYIIEVYLFMMLFKCAPLKSKENERTRERDACLCVISELKIVQTAKQCLKCFLASRKWELFNGLFLFGERKIEAKKHLIIYAITKMRILLLISFLLIENLRIF